MTLHIFIKHPQKNTNTTLIPIAGWGDILPDDRILEPDIHTPLIQVNADRELVAVMRFHKNCPSD
jgi:hypothetical protein